MNRSTLNPDEIAPPMALALASSFGSVEQWGTAVAALATAHGSAGGAILLVFDPQSGALSNRWAAAEEASDASLPLLTLPRSAEGEALFSRLDWPGAYQRHQDAVYAASHSLATNDITGALVLDVRRAGVFATAPSMLPGAAWHDPASVREWAPHLPIDRPVLVYCVYGHEVSRVTAMRLQSLGVQARFLIGGIDGWQRAGGATVAKGGAPS